MEKARKNTKEFYLKEKERTNTVLEELNEFGKIEEHLLKFIKSVGRKLPRLYSLSKVHKENIPVRPILSMSRCFSWKWPVMTAKYFNIMTF